MIIFIDVQLINKYLQRLVEEERILEEAKLAAEKKLAEARKQDELAKGKFWNAFNAL